MRPKPKTFALGPVLVGFLLAVQTALAGDPVGPRPQSGCHSVVLDSGSVVTRCESFPVHYFGPGLAGELNMMGSFSAGLLDPVDWKAVSRQFPEAIPRPPAGGFHQDRLLVVVDAGHGGSQTGAVGATGVEEKDIVLAVAEQTRLAFAGMQEVEVVMTRRQDEEISLWDRVEAANLLGADLFLSIHANAFSSSHLGGVETFFHSIEASGEEAKRVASAENAPGIKQAGQAKDALSYILQDMHSAEKLRDSSRLAHLVQDQLARVLPFDNRGVMQADFIVLRDTRMPSVLIELGFLTNPREEKVLTDAKVHKQIARAIRQGVIQFWELIKRKQVRTVQQKGSRP